VVSLFSDGCGLADIHDEPAPGAPGKKVKDRMIRKQVIKSRSLARTIAALSMMIGYAALNTVGTQTARWRVFLF
jgi:hypothetical protein